MSENAKTEFTSDIFVCEVDGIEMKDDAEILQHAKYGHRMVKKQIVTTTETTTVMVVRYKDDPEADPSLW